MPIDLTRAETRGRATWATLACLLLSLTTVGSAFEAMSATADTPRDVVAAIYAREIAESKKAVPGTAFTEKSVRARYFTKAFDRLISKAETAAEKAQDAGPIDFDPVISGQDGEVKALDVETERSDGSKAVVSAHFVSLGQKTKVTYDLVQENGAWRVDDIRGSLGSEAWSVRKILGGAKGRT